MSEVLILQASPRKNGACAQTAAALGALLPDAQVLETARLSIGACTGCGGCTSSGQCVQHDAMDELLARLAACRQLVLLSPVYFSYVPSGLKALADRLQPLWERPPEGRRRAVMAVFAGSKPEKNGQFCDRFFRIFCHTAGFIPTAFEEIAGTDAMTPQALLDAAEQTARRLAEALE